MSCGHECEKRFAIRAVEAARERSDFDVIDMGKLVSILTNGWKSKRKAAFIRNHCSDEIAQLPFYEGLGHSVKTRHILKNLFEFFTDKNKLAEVIAELAANDEIDVAVAPWSDLLLDWSADDISLLVNAVIESKCETVHEAAWILSAFCEGRSTHSAAIIAQSLLNEPFFADLHGDPQSLLEIMPQLEGKVNLHKGRSGSGSDDDSENGSVLEQDDEYVSDDGFIVKEEEGDDVLEGLDVHRGYQSDTEEEEEEEAEALSTDGEQSDNNTRQAPSQPQRQQGGKKNKQKKKKNKNKNKQKHKQMMETPNSAVVKQKRPYESEDGSLRKTDSQGSGSEAKRSQRRLKKRRLSLSAEE